MIILILKVGYGPRKWYHSEGPYDESSRDYECVFLYVDGIYRDKVTFEIEYEMNNAALRYGDCSELYLSFYSENTIKYLNSFNAEILIPDKDMPQPGNYEVHTYGTNANDFPFAESNVKYPGYHTFLINLDKSQLKFRPSNQYLELSLISYGQDRHIFTDYASYNRYYSDPVLGELRDEQASYELDYQKSKNARVLILLVFSAGAIIVIVYTFRKDKKVRQQHIFYNPTVQVQYYREIPSNFDPAFASALVFCKNSKPPRKNDANVYSSIILSLVRKGYIELQKIDPIKDWINSNVKIIVKCRPTPVINNLADIYVPAEPYAQVNSYAQLESHVQVKPQLEPLTPSEEHYFNLIIRHSLGNEISMSDFQSRVSTDYENTNSFIRNIQNSIVNVGISQGYFQKADYDDPKKKTKSLSTKFAVFGILLLTLINFISYQTQVGLALGAYTILGIAFIFSSFYLRKLAKKYVLLTQFGEDEYAKWKGLYDFLNSETLMSERTVVELPLWEQYLVYATAFGISEKVVAALKIRCPDVEMSPLLSNPYYRSSNFYYSCRSFRTATRTASHYSHSSGFGGHGGYGGGGRGGGGGRRRSLV